MKKFLLTLTISLIFAFLTSLTTKADEKDRFDQLSQAELDDHLRQSINREDGESLTKYEIQLDPFDDDSVHKIYKADEDYLYLSKNGETVLVEWDDIKPWVMCELYWLINMRQAGDYWAMAEYAFDHQLEIQGGEFLGEMVRLWKTLHRKADKFMAKKLDEEVPDEGFKWIDLRPDRCRLVTPTQMKAIDNADKIKDKVKDFEKELKNFSKSKPGEKRDESFSALKSLVKDVHDLYADKERFLMLKILLDAVKNTVKKTRDAKNRESKDKLEQLENARKEALTRIFDRSNYPDEISSAPDDRGQVWVNAAISDVIMIWNSEELGRMETQLRDFAQRYVALYNLIDNTQKYYTENEFKQQINLAVAAKIDKSIYKLEGIEETPEQLETRMLQEINAYRDMLGLEILKVENKMHDAARAHALHMSRMNVLASKINGHPYGETLEDRLDKAGYKGYSAFDLLSDMQKPEEIIKGWQNNPVDHRKLLAKDYTKIGTGISGKYCCVIYSLK